MSNSLAFTKYQLGTALCQVKNHLGIICISEEILHVGDQMQVRYYWTYQVIVVYNLNIWTFMD